MSRHELLRLLNKLFGSQAKAARQMNTPLRTIAAWGKENPVPKPVASLLRLLDDARSRNIGG